MPHQISLYPPAEDEDITQLKKVEAKANFHLEEQFLVKFSFFVARKFRN
jgi:hypothetical protein